KSTADILAAARAQKAAGAAPAAAAPKGEKAAPAAKAKPAAASAAAGDRPPIEQMLKALHEGKPAAETAPKPKLPGKPALPARRVEAVVVPRRSFPVEAALAVAALVATPFAAGMAMLAIISGLWTLLGARFMMPNMIVELPSKFKVGPPSDFPIGTVSEKYKASRGVWLVHSTAYNGENILYALASVCTHLGCTPNWLEGEQKFKCPCHGSGFYISGINFEGPAPRPLERVGLRVSEDGMLEVDKSVKFQEELGQWADGKSYVSLG
ncbi:MAG: ubiquinol-cytochrome c reductase iron-sulfur subunit, partial [Planctomycetaceae bacterium]